MLSLIIEEKLVGIITFISIIVIMNKQLVISRHKIVPINEWWVYLLSGYFFSCIFRSFQGHFKFPVALVFLPVRTLFHRVEGERDCPSLL